MQQTTRIHHLHNRRKVQPQNSASAKQVAVEAASVLRRNAAQGGQPGVVPPGGQLGATQQIPPKLAANAYCIVVFPNVNGSAPTGMAGTIVGATAPAGATTYRSSVAIHGASLPSERLGVASCRGKGGNWRSAAPVFVTISALRTRNPASTSSSPSTNSGAGNSIGGGSAQGRRGLALVLLFMNAEAANALQSGHVTFGNGVNGLHASAGPLTSATSPAATAGQQFMAPAPVLAYWTASAYSGSLEGANTFNTFKSASIGFAKRVNEQVYGQKVEPGDLLTGAVSRKEAKPRLQQLTAFNQALQQFAPSSRLKSSTSVVK